MLCNLADSRFNYSETQLDYWAKELQNDYPNSSVDGLTKIIRKGIKGGYKAKSNHITLTVIYDWIKQHTEAGKLPVNWWDLELTLEQWELVPPEKRSEKRNHDLRKRMGI